MKKSIGILAVCLLLNGGVQAAELQPDASAAAPQAVTEAAAAQVEAELYSRSKLHRRKAAKQNRLSLMPQQRVQKRSSLRRR